MATSFRGWGTSWANAWGPIAVDPNAMVGAAGFTLTAIATLTSGSQPGDISGSASLTFSAMGVLTALGVVTEESRVYGNGRGQGQSRGARVDTLTIEEVQAQWDLLEARLRTQDKPASNLPATKQRVPDAPQATQAPALEIAKQTIQRMVELRAVDQAQRQQELAAIRAKRAEEDAFILMLLANS